MAALTDPMLPRPFRIEKVTHETADTFTFELSQQQADGDGRFDFACGQFNMLYTFGTGEIPVSISGDPAKPQRLVHTIRAVGSVTRAMKKLKKGDTLGVRGPFGSAWPVQQAEGNDVIIIAGGIGLAPLRPAICSILQNREKYGHVALLYGARTPQDILFEKELREWRGRFDMQVMITVDHAVGTWKGNIGVVPDLIKRVKIDPDNTIAMVCGPEIMMRFCVIELHNRGMEHDTIFVSMERNMKCGIGLCGHCQYGPEFICKDGPVFPFSKIRTLFDIYEL
ncbi:MAG TPA: Ni/Fe hydrogenase subunit gamma [Bacteroidetes bacterium]|nr:Ni/Fe hydrogenase subunit gamma [Bacteroidota bacterium]